MSSDLGEEVDGASHGPEGRRGDVAVGRLQRPRRVVPEAGRERDARAAACCRLLRGIRRDGTIQQAADVRGEPLAGARAEELEELAEGPALGAGGNQGERGVDGQR